MTSDEDLITQQIARPNDEERGCAVVSCCCPLSRSSSSVSASFGHVDPERSMPKKKPKAHDDWIVLPAGEMRRKFGLYAENRPLIELDPKRVPERLRKLIPLAEKFGISDDLIREDFFAKASKRELTKLKRILSLHDDLLNEWLAGPEAKGPEFSDEYIAFCAMRMGVDCL